MASSQYGLQEEQVTRAAQSLAAILEYKRRQESEGGGVRALFDEDEDVFLLFALHRTPVQAKNKPYQIPLAHSLFGQDGQEVCLITKDPGTDIKSHLEEHPIPGVTKVINFTNLKRNYNTYTLKREILNSYDLFLADDRILRLLPPVLGKSFFTRKKQPFPVVLKGRNFSTQVAKARDSTYFFLTSGPSTSVRVARSSFSVEEIVANVMGAVEPIVEHIPRKWKNVQAIYLKSAKSTALPIFTSLPQQTKITSLSDTTLSTSDPAGPSRKRKGPLLKKSASTPSESPPESKASKKRKTSSVASKAAKLRAKAAAQAKTKAQRTGAKGKKKSQKAGKKKKRN